MTFLQELLLALLALGAWLGIAIFYASKKVRSEKTEKAEGPYVQLPNSFKPKQIRIVDNIVGLLRKMEEGKCGTEYYISTSTTDGQKIVLWSNDDSNLCNAYGILVEQVQDDLTSTDLVETPLRKWRSSVHWSYRAAIQNPGKWCRSQKHLRCQANRYGLLVSA